MFSKIGICAGFSKDVTVDKINKNSHNSEWDHIVIRVSQGILSGFRTESIHSYEQSHILVDLVSCPWAFPLYWDFMSTTKVRAKFS